MVLAPLILFKKKRKSTIAHGNSLEVKSFEPDLIG